MGFGFLGLNPSGCQYLKPQIKYEKKESLKCQANLLPKVGLHIQETEEQARPRHRGLRSSPGRLQNLQDENVWPC